MKHTRSQSKMSKSGKTVKSSKNKKLSITSLINTDDLASMTNSLNIIKTEHSEWNIRKKAKQFMQSLKSGLATREHLDAIRQFIDNNNIRVLIPHEKPKKSGKRVKSYLPIGNETTFTSTSMKRRKSKSLKNKRKSKSKSEYARNASKERQIHEEQLEQQREEQIRNERMNDEPPKPIEKDKSDDEHVDEQVDESDDNEKRLFEYLEQDHDEDIVDDNSSDDDFEITDWEFVQRKNKNGSDKAPHYELKFFVKDYDNDKSKCLKAIIFALKSIDEEILLGTHNYFIDFYFTGVSHHWSHVKLNTEKYAEAESKSKSLLQMLENTLHEMNTGLMTSETDFIQINELCRFYKYEEMSMNKFDMTNFEGAIIKRYVNISENAKLLSIVEKQNVVNGRKLEYNEIEQSYVIAHKDNNPGFCRYHFNVESYPNLPIRNKLVDLLHELQIYTSTDDMLSCKNHKVPCFVQTIIAGIKRNRPTMTDYNLCRLKKTLMTALTTKHVNIAKMHQTLYDLQICLSVTEIKINDLSKTYSKACVPMTRTENNKRKTYFGRGTDENAIYKVSAFMIDKHLFVNYVIDKDLIDKLNCRQLLLKGKGVSSVTTGNLVYKMFQNQMFQTITLSTFNILKTFNHDEVAQDITDLIIDDTTVKSFAELSEKRKFKKNKSVTRLWFADFEAFTNRETTGVHQAFMICFCNETSSIITMSGPTCPRDFLDYVVSDSQKYMCSHKLTVDDDKDKQTIVNVVYFHNLSYDINFLAYKGIQTSINNGTNYFAATITHHGFVIHFRDSLKLISTKLEKFPQMFKLECGPKEVFPYDLYNDERLYKIQKWPIKDADQFEKERWTPTKMNQFIDNVKRIPNCQIDDDYFNLYTYAKFYCEQDVRILREGLLKFDKLCLEALEIKATDKLSVSSLANAYLEKVVYSKIKDDLYFLGGSLMLYTKKFVAGGRTMCAYNKRWIMNDESTPIVDFDAISMYTSAMNRLEIQGGKPEMININDIPDIPDIAESIYWSIPEWLKEYNSYLVEIDILRVGQHYAFPLILKRKSILPYTKDTIDPIEGNFYDDTGINPEHPCHQYVDNYKLEDLVKYQGICFRFRSESLKNGVIGLGWRGKKYDVLSSCVQNLYNQRLQYKKEGNPLQEVLKLIMNSIYGKMIESEHVHNYVYKRDETYIDKKGKRQNQFLKYISRNNYKILDFTPVINYDGTDSAINCIKVVNPVHKCFRNSLLGIHVLSMSKRIINEVTCTAHKNHIPMFYTDTDSVHLYYNDLSKLATVYEERYGKPLIGNQLGQFHSDFPSFGSSKAMPVSIYSNFVAKKFYIDILKNENSEYYPFVRCKGIPNECIKNYVYDNYNLRRLKPIPKEEFDKCLDNECTPYSKDICDMYKRYYEDVAVKGLNAEYNLAEKHLKLKKTLSFQISTLNDFTRTVRSRYKQGEIKNFFPNDNHC